MERFNCRALVLASVDYGEADRVVTLLTDERGRLAAFARSARKSRRRFPGALEPFTLLRVQLCETRGQTFRLDGAEVEDGFGELREEIGRAARAAYATELARELCRDHQPHPEMFALLCRFLGALARAGAGAEALMRFELSALAVAGLRPRLDRCARCGSARSEQARFDPGHGGLVCAPCAGRSGFPASRDAIGALASLQRSGESGPLPEGARTEARVLLSGYLAHHLERRLKSLDFMLAVGVEF